MISLAATLADCPLLAGLEEDQRKAFLDGRPQTTMRPGSVIMRQGDRSTSAFLLAAGEAGVFTRLPGGGETQIASVGPGSVLGEVGLLLDVPRSATLRALTDCTVLEISRGIVDAWLVQLGATGLTLFRNLAGMLARRVDEQCSAIASIIADYHSVYTLEMPVTGQARQQGAAGLAPFLPSLPALRDFSAADIETLLEMGRASAVSRGESVLGKAGETDFHILARGAAIIGLAHGGRCHPLAVLGPGALIGLGGILDVSGLKDDAIAMGPVSLLSIPAARLKDAVMQRTTLSASILRAIALDRAFMVSRLARHSTRLAGLTRIGASQVASA